MYAINVNVGSWTRLLKHHNTYWAIYGATPTVLTGESRETPHRAEELEASI